MKNRAHMKIQQPEMCWRSDFLKVEFVAEKVCERKAANKPD